MLALSIPYSGYVAELKTPHWDFLLDYTFMRSHLGAERTVKERKKMLWSLEEKDKKREKQTHKTTLG